jgi:hypothetical protein
MKRSAWVVIAIAGALVVFGGSAAVVSSIAGFPPYVLALAYAVAIAERGAAEIQSGNIARNNPGDIEAGGQLVSYSSIEEGWAALYSQVARFFSGSSLYSPSMTVQQLAHIYVDGPNAPISQDAQDWAVNVANVLGVSVSTTVSQIQGMFT